MYKIPANTLFLGKNLVFVPECHSTNTLLMELAQKTQSIEGTLIITANQTKGRGQRGNGWETEPGVNFTMSLLLRPTFLMAKDQFQLTQAISLGIADYLSERLTKSISIKWPNDILVGNKKITGILIENTLSGDYIQQSIIGIGLNVNQTTFKVPTATSMLLEKGNTFQLQDELGLLLVHIEKRYLQLRAGKKVDLNEEYLKQLYWKGEARKFSANEKILVGKIEGVDSIGRLLVRHGDKVDSFGLKEIAFVE